MKTIKQIILFSLFGTTGLLVDLVVLYITSQFFDFVNARLISFFFAVITTWVFNRNFTFKTETDTKLGAHNYYSYLYEFIKYFISNSFGGLINLSTYYLYLKFNEGSVDIYIATVLGGIAGLVLNFALSKIMVFE